MLLASLFSIDAGPGLIVEKNSEGIKILSLEGGSAAAVFVCLMKRVHRSRKEINTVDPLSILSLVSLVSDIAVNVVALATDAWNAVESVLPH